MISDHSVVINYQYSPVYRSFENGAPSGCGQSLSYHKASLFYIFYTLHVEWSILLYIFYISTLHVKCRMHSTLPSLTRELATKERYAESSTTPHITAPPCVRAMQCCRIQIFKNPQFFHQKSAYSNMGVK